MAADVQIDWYTDDVVLAVEAATQDLVAKIAFAIEAQAKVNVIANDQVDTGAMLNGIYTRTPAGSGYGQAAAEASTRRPEAAIALEADLPDDNAALVHAAMEYAIYQEDRLPFLYPAVEAVQRQVPAMVSTVARSRGLV